MNINKLHHLPKVDTRKLKAPKPAKKATPCFKEITGFLTCLKGDGVRDLKNCKAMEVALQTCMKETQLAKNNAPTQKSSMTYHLQRLAREMGYRF